MRKLILIVLIPLLMGNANIKFTQYHSVELHLEKEEGYREKAYWDKNGYAVCFGNRYLKNGDPVKEDEVKTRRECLSLLSHHLKNRTEPILKRIHVDLTPTQKTVVLSTTYRWGLGGVLKTGLIEAVNNQDYDKIKEIILGQKEIKNRAEREWELWRQL